MRKAVRDFVVVVLIFALFVGFLSWQQQANKINLACTQAPCHWIENTPVPSLLDLWKMDQQQGKVQAAK